MMKAQDILDGVCRHRAVPVNPSDPLDIRRKFDELEWAAQATAEFLVELETSILKSLKGVTHESVKPGE